MYVESQLDGLGFSLKKTLKKIKKAAKKLSYALPGTALVVPTKGTAKGALTSLAVGGTIATAGQAAGSISAPSGGGFQMPDWMQKAKTFYDENKAKVDALKSQYDALKSPSQDVPESYVDTGQLPVQASMFGNVPPVAVIGAISGAALLFALLTRGKRRH